MKSLPRARRVRARRRSCAFPCRSRPTGPGCCPRPPSCPAANLWVTVDAAISNDLFYFEHNPIRLDNLAITAPDGSPVKAENASTGKFRSTFDVPLAQPGTYKIAVVNDMAAAMYEDGGETKRWRGFEPRPSPGKCPPGRRTSRCRRRIAARRCS